MYSISRWYQQTHSANVGCLSERVVQLAPPHPNFFDLTPTPSLSLGNGDRPQDAGETLERCPEASCSGRGTAPDMFPRFLEFY